MPFALKDRGELLEYRRGGETISIALTWSLHCRVYADPELRTSTRTITGRERIAILEDVVAYLRTQTQGLIEVVGEPSLGDRVVHTAASLGRDMQSENPFTRNSAIHEMRGIGHGAIPLWYGVLTHEADTLCVSSAFGLLLDRAGLRSWDHRAILFRLTQSAPGSAERAGALDDLRQLLRRSAPATLAAIEPAGQ